MKRIFGAVIFLMPILFAAVEAYSNRIDCVNFESQALNSEWGTLHGDMPDQRIFIQNGIEVLIENYTPGSGSTAFLEKCRIIQELSEYGFGLGQIIDITNINLKFSFGRTVNYVSFEFAHLAGIENISVDDHPIIPNELVRVKRDIAPNVVMLLEYSDITLDGENIGVKGRIILKGQMNTLLIGGQEFFLDNVCAGDSNLLGDKQISGSVNMGIDNDPVGNVAMCLTGGALALNMTNTSGEYRIENVQAGLNYTVTPYKTAEVRRSLGPVSFFDAALVCNFWAGKIPLTPQQRKAANVKEDDPIDCFDASLIARFAAELPPFNENDHTGQWRFEPMSRLYTRLILDQTGQEYSATLLGDIDGSWPSSTLAKDMATVEDYTDLNDLVASTGDVVIIPLLVDDGANIISADIDFEYDPRVLQFIEVSKTELSMSFEVVTNAKIGQLHCGAYGTEAIMETGAILLLKFKVIGKEGSRSSLTLARYQLNGGIMKRAEKELIVRTSAARISN